MRFALVRQSCSEVSSVMVIVMYIASRCWCLYYAWCRSYVPGNRNSITQTVMQRVATRLAILENSGNLKVIGEKSWNMCYSLWCFHMWC